MKGQRRHPGCQSLPGWRRLCYVAAMKIALLQINPVIGELAANSRKIVDGCARAAVAGCQLAILPELALSGYPPRDLLERPAFRAEHQQALEELVGGITDIGVLCGAFVAHPEADRGLANAALLFAEGRILATVAKRLLPNYDVFDECRYFQPGPPVVPCRFQGCNLGITICEDVWNATGSTADHQRGGLTPAYGCDPVGELVAAAGDQEIDLLVNIAASPFTVGKHAFREKMLAGIANRYRLPVALVNQVGGQDSLVFDGGSLALAEDGHPLVRAARFAEDLVVFDLDNKKGSDPFSPSFSPSAGDEKGEIMAALELGTRDYVHKCGFARVVIGLSGGIDSALTAAVAARALGPEQVLGVAMPSPYSAAASLEDARALAANLGIAFAELPIATVRDTFLATLAPLLGEVTGELPDQNIQARIRGTLLMAIANQQGRLLLATGNKSELAVGYCTLYGDMCGALAVLADVYKTVVYELADWLNRERELIPARTITRPPSAELAPEQRDDNELPPYGILDPILQAHLEEQLPAAAIVQRGYEPAVVADVIRRVRLNEYKRQQAPPALKITARAFGVGRRYPIAANYIERISP
ncbi:MAG: NAD+ synthase [Desulfurivibrio sp.]|nr:NAD+ synthase [Desulfurivibrio sp.]